MLKRSLFYLTCAMLIGGVCATVLAVPAYLWMSRWQAKLTGEVAVAQLRLRKAAAEDLDAANVSAAEEEEEPERYEYPPFDVDRWREVIATETAALPTRLHSEQSPTPFRLVSARTASDVATEPGTDEWAYRRLRPVQVPAIASPWVRNPIDQFVLQRLEQHGLVPNEDADRSALARRLWFDLLGLPPQPEELTEFLQQTDTHAYGHAVDHLLERPEFGERWATFWLDIARYADSNGYEEDELKPYAFPYRDFVIWAMNVDLPYDRFIQWQVAGDELAPESAMAVAATGFFTNAPYNSFMPQPSERMDELDDQVTTLGRAMLGLTVGCARCHDHPYDDISSAEYYRLIAILKDTKRSHEFLISGGAAAYREHFDPVEERRQQLIKMLIQRKIDDNIEALDFTDEEKDLLRQPIDPENEEQQLLLAFCMRCMIVTESHVDLDMEPLERDCERFDRIMAEYTEMKAALPPLPPQTLVLSGSTISQQAVLERGDLAHPGELVGPGFLTLASAQPTTWQEHEWMRWADASLRPRSALARWMTDTQRGAGSLLARVIVNRIWQQHFGEGLARTPSDFGAHGDPPSHPDLLDWLAHELVEHDWSLKHIHRLIVNSSTYRQSAYVDPQKLAADPENRLLSRRVPRRMTAEAIHDSMLVAASALHREMYGRSVVPPIPREAIYNTQYSVEYTWPAVEPDSVQLDRRGIYTFKKRTIPVPMRRLLDAPDGTAPCEVRKHTTVPTQALALWNGPFARQQAVRLAHRLMTSGSGESREDWIHELFMIALSREPQPEEVEFAMEFLQNENDRDGSLENALAELCHVILMTNEFVYID